MRKAIALFTVLVILILGWIIRTPDIPVEELKKRYCDEKSQFMDVNGLEVHYKSEGSGFPVVLIHGTASSLHTWDKWTQRLRSEYRVIRMDIPAFGITGPTEDHDYSIDFYVEFLNDFLEKLEIDRMYLAGNSLGGRISWNYARTYPEKVKKLILVDASGLDLPGDPDSSIGFKIAKTPVINWLLTVFTPKSLHRKSILEVYADSSLITEELVKRYYDLMLRPGNRKAFVERVKVENKVNPPHLDEISCPTLIQWGKNDRWIPYGHAEVYQDLIRNSEVIIYEDAGHVPMEEIPGKTVSDAMEFLAE